MYRRNIDLTQKEHTIGKALKDNYEWLMTAKDKVQAKEMLTKVFTDNAINTPKSREILFKMDKMNTQFQVIKYISDIVLAASGNAIYGSKKGW